MIPKKKLITAKIKRALDKNYTIYWQRRGSWVELRAITYTWENGNYRTAKLAEFYLREAEEYLHAFDVAIAVEDYQPSHSQQGTSIEKALEEAWYQGGVIPIEETPSKTYRVKRGYEEVKS